jgi:hypothetical protein
MVEQPGWKLVAEFGATYEAVFAVARLEAAGIPVLRKGPETGIFGPGFGGFTPGGVQILVPADRLEDARAILRPEGGSSD